MMVVIADDDVVGAEAMYRKQCRRDDVCSHDENKHLLTAS